MGLRFQNTLTGEEEPFQPLEPGRVRLYTCGPTVHDRIHVGNFRTFLFEDVLRRTLRYLGYEVEQVMNVTDVEDKIIRKAREAGLPIAEYTAAYTRRFFEDLELLGAERAEHYPRATAYVPEMVRLIRRLGELGHTYERDGSIYFRIVSFPGYGKLSKIDLSGSRDGVRVDADEYDKDDPKDFVLWKAAKPGEDFWETELGPGRPGWHIECSAMAMALLGESFDIHTGGVDNIFPHHENEIAQSESATGKPFARYWLHAQHLLMEERKMAKSLGNLVTLGELVERGHDPMAVRYLLIAAHYRTLLQFSDESLGQAAAALGRLRDFAYRLDRAAERGDGAASREPSVDRGAGPDGGRDRRALRDDDVEGGARAIAGFSMIPEPIDELEVEAKRLVAEAEQGFREGLEDDLNTPRALAALFTFVREANALLDRRESAVIADRFRRALGRWDAVLGVLGASDMAVPAEISGLLAEREAARSRKDYGRSDEIRRALLSRGFAVEDTPAGPRLKSVPPS